MDTFVLLFCCLICGFGAFAADDNVTPRVDGLRRHIQFVFTELEYELAKEEHQIQKLINAQSPCLGNETEQYSEQFENNIWNMNQVASRCHKRVQNIRGRVRDVQVSFRSTEERTRLESAITQINASIADISKTLIEDQNITSKTDDELDDINNGIFYLKHMNKNTLKYLFTKSPWRSDMVKLDHRKLKMRITGCPNWIVECSVYDIAAFDDDSFIVTYANQSVIRRFNSNGILLSEFKFPWNLGGIASINETHIIVGAPEKNSLIMMSVPGGFVVTRYVLMDTNCGIDIDIHKPNSGFILGCRNPSSIRIYSNEWKLEKVIAQEHGSLLSLIHYQEHLKLPNSHRIFPESPRGAVWDRRSNVWYMVSPISNEIQRVTKQGLNKRTLFYVRKPTAISFLYKKRIMIIGTEKGSIYLAIV